MRTRMLVPLSCFALVAVAALPAYAVGSATYSAVDQVYNYSGDGTAEAISVSCNAGSVVPASAPDAPCADVESMYIIPGAGIDTVSLVAVTPATFPQLELVTISAPGDGVADTITGSSLVDDITADSMDIVFAGPGDDIVDGGSRVDGGDGNDTFNGVNAEQGVTGGPGDDRFVDSLSPGGSDGGPGEDSMDIDFNTATRGGDLSLVFGANSVKAVTEFVDVEYPVSSIEHLTVSLPESGNNTVDLSAFPGDGIIYGHGGPDVITGSKKVDILRGGTGDDTINARDGGFDIVDCGSGNDTATVDTVDAVVGCESVSLPPVADTSAISGPAKVKKGKKATFTFSSTIAGSGFTCQLDKQAAKPCASPYKVKTKKLKLGKHKLTVTAAGDPTPSGKKFAVKRP